MPRPRMTEEEYRQWCRYRDRVDESEGNERIEWNDEENTVTVRSKRIKTLDELLEHAEVDLNVYEVERKVVNSWEVTSWKRGFAETMTNFQVKAWLKNKYFNKADPEWIANYMDALSLTLPKAQTERFKGDADIVCAIADLHCGGFTENMKLVPDYNISVLSQKLANLSKLLIATGKNVHLKILGDLIESFTGKNHKDTWKQIEQHGIKVMFTVADMLTKLINDTPNIVSVELISGNHDRISSANDDDTEGQVAYGVAELLSRSTNVPIKFDPLVLSSSHDNVNYILLHGHLPIAKKNPAEIILDYGDQNMYNVLITAHKHSEAIFKSTTKIKHHQVPSLVPANNFAESLGAHSPTGIVLFQANDYGSVDTQSKAL
jgi:hypothetical protein